MNQQEKLLNQLTRKAHRQRHCIVAKTNAERMQLLRASRTQIVKQVKAHLYMPSAAWEALTHPERAMYLMRATNERHPEWTFCYLSAALIWELTGTIFLKAQMHVAASNHTHVRCKASIKFHYCLVKQAQQRAGLSVTPLIQTVYDCARRLDYANALAICDKAMRKYGLTKAQLIDYANLSSHTWGRTRALYVFSHATPLSESGGESIAKARFDGWGYQQPQQQVNVSSPLRGGKLIRLDFSWLTDSGKQVAAELDGYEKYVNPKMTGGQSLPDIVFKEKDRETELSLSGYLIIRFSYHQLRERHGLNVKKKLTMAQVPKEHKGTNPEVISLFSTCWESTHTCWAGVGIGRRPRSSSRAHDSRRPPSRPKAHARRKPPQEQISCLT
ncbi:hypothetical protein [Bombiscardovia apis]|uniref:hypothetical protein n=1 Tax=Bombiscardovia apis TaxID=2932182 RepID=UPI002954DD07|nr:hypothetical protein [Bombiscardovia apis]